MHIIILGAGLAGVSAAWYLSQAGHQVTVLDRQPQPGLETSYANGSQISVSHPEPWANPGAPRQVLRWLGREDAPLLFRLRADPQQWRWGLQFLHECLPARARRNTAAIARLGRYSLAALRALRAETGIRYQHLERGILHVFFSREDFAAAPEHLAVLHEYGIAGRLCTAEECVTIEPALASVASTLAGGLYGYGDETGNARLFCQHLASLAASRGVRFVMERRIEQLERRGRHITAVHARTATGEREHWQADRYVLALGSYSPLVMAELGVSLPVYPVKGYSITVPIIDPARAPEVSITDESRRIVCSRLDDQLRVAGTAELNGYDLSLPAARWQPLLRWLDTRFPGACDLTQAEPWAGLRPATPSNVPLIGASPFDNLFYNTGHGTLGWTLACGSAKALARHMDGLPAEVEFPFTS